MSAIWDFRSILDVYPNESFNCVGTTNQGSKCQQWMFSRTDLARASAILDQMNAHNELSASYEYLEELAEFTLCPRWHRTSSQLQDVTAKWRKDIAVYELKFKREQQNAALIDSKRALSQMKESVVEIKVKLEDESHPQKISTEIKPPAEEGTSASVAIVKTETKTSALASALISRPPRAKAALPASSDNTISRVPKGTESDSDSKPPTKLPLEKIHLPSPPNPPLSLKISLSDKAKPTIRGPVTPIRTPRPSPSQQTFAIIKASTERSTTTTGPGETSPKTLSQEKTKTETFNFEFPPTPDATPEAPKKRPLASFAYEFGVKSQLCLPGFKLKGNIPPLPTLIPVAEVPRFCLDSKSRPASEDSQAVLSNQVSKISASSFGFTTSMLLSKLPLHEPDPFVSLPPISATKISKSQADSVPVASNTTPGSFKQVSDTEDHSYGFATVAPFSMRYKSYLPSQQPHALVMPPETPERLQDTFSAFVLDSSYSLSAQLLFPKTPLIQIQAEEDENERVRCFPSLRICRLRARVVQKMENLKVKIPTVFRSSS